MPERRFSLYKMPEKPPSLSSTRSLNSPPILKPVTPRRPPGSSPAQRRSSPPSKWTAIRFRSSTPCPRRSSRRSSKPRLSSPRPVQPSIMAAAGPSIVPQRTAFSFPRAKPSSAPRRARRRKSFYSTLLHELVHLTSAESRCNRQLGKRFGDQAYAIEEPEASSRGTSVSAGSSSPLQIITLPFVALVPSGQ